MIMATILIADIPMHLLHKNPDKECKEQITDINMCHQIRETELKESFVPTDSISQAIHFFSDTHASFFIIIFANQMLSKKTESIKGTLKGDKVGLK